MKCGEPDSVLIAFCVSLGLGFSGPLMADSWTSAGSLTLPRYCHQSTLLSDGRVLVTGGFTFVGNGYDTKVAEVYDPALNSWSTTGSTTKGRADHTATLLNNGKVLVAGGTNANICANDTTTELYDPTSGTWSFTGNLPLARTGHTATLLADGRVLLAGGGDRCGGVFDSASLYDPATGAWSSTGNMTVRRQFHSAVRLLNGKVLIAGGLGWPSPFPALSSAELYDPTTGTWSATASMATTRAGGNGSTANSLLALLTDGRVLVTGGTSGHGFLFIPNGPSVEVYDPSMGTWIATGSLSVARLNTGSYPVLNDGRVLAAAGWSGSTELASAELWNPSLETWFLTASLTVARNCHSSTRLATGQVLVAAGLSGNTPITSAELFTPDVEVRIDIKPGSDPNCFNSDGNGVIPVAILSSADFDATEVDPMSVSLDGQAVRVVGKKGTAQAHVEDVNGDQLDDLVLQIADQDGTYAAGDTTATLTGETFEGTKIQGTDSICIVP